MLNIVKAEYQKTKNSMSRRLIWAFPLITFTVAFVLTAGMKNAYAESVWNWWYTLLDPGIIAQSVPFRWRNHPFTDWKVVSVCFRNPDADSYPTASCLAKWYRSSRWKSIAGYESCSSGNLLIRYVVHFNYILICELVCQERGEITMLIKNLRADLLKMKGLSVALAHILIPVITSGIFLMYYTFSPWDANIKIIAFYQAVGAGFPVLIGIFTAALMEQEYNAGNFQNLLTMPEKTMAFLSKLLILLLFSLFSVLLTIVIFGAGFVRISGNHTISIGTCLLAAFIMWCSSIPLYIWQIILAFRFGKGVSIGAGIISGLVCALMLTDFGMFVWKYIPVSWTGRIPYCYLKLVLGEAAASREIKVIMPVYGIFTLVSMVYYFIWASHWEGSKISE